MATYAAGRATWSWQMEQSPAGGMSVTTSLPAGRSPLAPQQWRRDGAMKPYVGEPGNQVSASFGTRIGIPVASR